MPNKKVAMVNKVCSLFRYAFLPYVTVSFCACAESYLFCKFSLIRLFRKLLIVPNWRYFPWFSMDLFSAFYGVICGFMINTLGFLMGLFASY
jgi:hypothetical protein